MDKFQTKLHSKISLNNYISGSIGVTISTNWLEPASSSIEDEEAAERARAFVVG